MTDDGFVGTLRSVIATGGGATCTFTFVSASIGQLGEVQGEYRLAGGHRHVPADQAAGLTAALAAAAKAGRRPNTGWSHRGCFLAFLTPRGDWSLLAEA